MTLLAIILLILALLLLGLYLASRQAVRNAEATFPAIGEFVTVEGIRLHYLCRGTGQSVVLLHGNAGFVQDYALKTLDRLAPQYRAYAFDRPGHAYSDRSANGITTPIDQARLLHGAFQQLGIEQPIIVGHSWSGIVVLAYALEYPEDISGIVLLAAVTLMRGEGVNPILEQIAAIPILGDIFRLILPLALGGKLVEQVLTRAFAPDSVPEEYLRTAQALWTRPSQTAAVAEDNQTITPAIEALSPRYADIRIPTVIVTGDSDQIVDAEANSIALSQVIPDAILIQLSDTSHSIPQTRPDAILNAISQVSEFTGLNA
ncbi:MAG: alpha/beta hydrolase [Leptolyngbyaceae cyanobacterium MO_188.B28]|nr:alpha/beta hydrolase [Leptolyngbyaceae cyanobacterium MO_188.B28]